VKCGKEGVSALNAMDQVENHFWRRLRGFQSSEEAL